MTSTSNGPLRNTSPISSSKPPSTPGDSDGPPPAKRLAMGDSVDDPLREAREARDREVRERFERFMPPHLAMPSAHLKITSRSEYCFLFSLNHCIKW